MSNIDNKTHSTHKTHGEILSEIARELRRYLTMYPMAVIVREEALANIATSAHTVQVLHKVVGVSDLYAWAFGQRVFDEVPPKTVKKLVANDSLAEKDAVAAALEQFVGAQTYACDDESDAVAVGIAWLLQRGMIDDPYAPKEEPPPPKKRKSTKKK